MRKSRLVSGDHFYGIKVEHYVTMQTFAKALADWYWGRSEVFDPHLSRKEAKKILNHGLFFKGNEGIETIHWEGASEEFIKPFNDAYDAACEWVRKNYPYLNQ